MSENVLGEGTMQVRGLSWCRDEFREVPTAGFARNMLCQEHNQRLSPVDEAGGAAWRALTAFAESARQSALAPKGARPISLRVSAVDGERFERWLLKTVINVAFQGAPQGREPWTPPKEWVELAFGLKPFPPRCGLYLATAERRLGPHGQNRLSMRVVTYPGTAEPCGGQMKINDWEVAVTLVPLLEDGWAFRPRVLRLQHRLKTFRVLRFDWPKAT